MYVCVFLLFFFLFQVWQWSKWFRWQQWGPEGRLYCCCISGLAASVYRNRCVFVSREAELFVILHSVVCMTVVVKWWVLIIFIFIYMILFSLQMSLYYLVWTAALGPQKPRLREGFRDHAKIPTCAVPHLRHSQMSSRRWWRSTHSWM